MNCFLLFVEPDSGQTSAMFTNIRRVALAHATRASLFLLLLAAAPGCVSPPPKATVLFDGSTLTGWATDSPEMR